MTRIATIAGLAALGMTVIAIDEGRDLLREDGARPSRKPAPRLPREPAAPKTHKHSREIARRLKQQCRVEAKKGQP